MSKIFPLVDHLYIFQILEYNIWDFLKWFIKHPFKRNLQKKHTLEWTAKAKLLFLISLLLILIDSAKGSLFLFQNLWFSPLFIPLVIFFSPIFLVVSQILLLPLEYYQKDKILNQTKLKLNNLSKLKIIAITGSFGKTSTKDILYTLLWKKFRVVKTPRSYNNPLSIASTIFELVKEDTQILIAEVGAYKKGEIKKIAKLIKPQVGIITAIAPQHLEKFGSIENIANSKFELIESLPSNGLAVLNGESEWLVNLSKNAPCKVIFYGGREIIDTKISYSRYLYQYTATDIQVSTYGTSFLLSTPKGKIKIEIPLIGEHYAKNFLAAATIALQLGLSLNEVRQRAKLLLPTPHRLEIKKQGNITLIDNSYNTNPESSKLSFKLLKDYPGDQKIIITPGLIELGRQSEKENIEFGKDANKVADEIIIVGENAREFLVKGLKEANFPKEKIHIVLELKDGLNLLSQIGKPNAIVLLENDLPDNYF
ncbi:UDP-N-acetylmuramoyl-tripeptide--D-alanyl-D-alanine ligase [Candidatus Daviesbacteria bacterium]|nr:UDP-N-acetylmuramoyl-tripeptide--D-alanyl-D-alanine ligase [Candidatus Daviesbacteria bacterium]